MKFVDEYRDPRLANEYARRIANAVTRPWTLMEVCGGQTHAVVRFGLDEMLPADITLIHGPGCPVCVTPIEMIDKAIAIDDRVGSLEVGKMGDVVVFSGDLDKIIAHVDRILLLHEGRLVRAGHPDDILPIVEQYGVREPDVSRLGMTVRSWLN